MLTVVTLLFEGKEAGAALFLFVLGSEAARAVVVGAVVVGCFFFMVAEDVGTGVPPFLSFMASEDVGTRVAPFLSFVASEVVVGFNSGFSPRSLVFTDCVDICCGC